MSDIETRIETIERALKLRIDRRNKSVAVASDLHEQIYSIAKKEGMTMTTVASRLICEGLKRTEPIQE